MSNAYAWDGDINRNGQIDYGDRGAAVECAQQAAIYDGFSVGSTGADGKFGWATHNGVRAYQTYNRDPSGAALSVDGQVGPRTGGAMTADVRRYRDIARSTGETAEEARMNDWLSRCVGRYTDNRGRQIFW
jgi:peptidoglycan hydrolase-like protein with peptidoglycan-binding domain